MLTVSVNLKNDNIKYYNFHKTKWQKLIFNILLRNRFDNQYYKLFDQSLHIVPFYTNRFSKSFKEYFLLKKQFKIFYGCLKDKEFLKLINKSQRKAGETLLNFVERRLDVVLVRGNFALTLKNAQQLISHGYVFVDKRQVKTKSFLLKKGNKVTINFKAHKLIEYYILLSLMWPILPKYLQIDYKIFQILIIEGIKVTNNSYHF